MTRLESVKNYINAEIEERGLIDNQIKIDFADICETNEAKEAAKELGFEAEKTEGQGVWWIYK